jgi:hypothetical protein
MYSRVLFFGLVCSCAIGLPSLAQTKWAKNAIYADLNGWAMPTLNYERMVWQQGKNRISLRAGALVVPNRVGNDGSPYPSYPSTGWIASGGINLLRGPKNHLLEVGLSYNVLRFRQLIGFRSWTTIYVPTYEVIPITNDTYLATFVHHQLNFRVGYRYQKPQGGFMFRAGISPISWFISGTRGFTFGAAALQSGDFQRSLVFLPIPDIGFGWSF